MNRSVLLAAAGIAAVVIGLTKPIEPLIEVGVALVVMAMITNPKPKS